MSRHVESCLQKHLSPKASVPSTKDRGVFLIEIVGYKRYWMYVEVLEYTTLADLDQFLRGIWLECCGHLSEFNIYGQRFSDDTEDGEECPTTVGIAEVLGVGDSFKYTYDFGSSTDLSCRILSVRRGTMKKRIQVLARNHLPELPCVVCQKEASSICMWCGEGVCRTCVKKHSCGNGKCECRPFVNSPRAGVCGYEGSAEDMHRYAPDLG